MREKRTKTGEKREKKEGIERTAHHHDIGVVQSGEETDLLGY